MLIVTRQNRGIGLLELMLSLAIIGTLIIMATQYFGVVTERQRVMRTIDKVQAIRAASERAVVVGFKPASSDNILPSLIARNYLPANIQNNPWGGDVIMVAAVPNAANIHNIIVQVNNMTKDSCRSLVDSLPNTAVPSSIPGNCGCQQSPPNYCGVFSVLGSS